MSPTERCLDSTAEITNRGQCLGERKDFEVYSCDISPDGSRLVTAAGGEFVPRARWLGEKKRTLVLIPAVCLFGW